MISRVKSIRPNMLTRSGLQDFMGRELQIVLNRTCLQGIRSGLQYLMGWELQIVLDRTCLRGIRTRLQDLTDSEHHIEHAYSVSGQCCRISQERNIGSYMPTRYQDGAEGSHG